MFLITRVHSWDAFWIYFWSVINRWTCHSEIYTKNKCHGPMMKTLQFNRHLSPTNLKILTKTLNINLVTWNCLEHISTCGGPYLVLWYSSKTKGGKHPMLGDENRPSVRTYRTWLPMGPTHHVETADFCCPWTIFHRSGPRSFCILVF